MLCERVRPFYAAEILSADQLREAAECCREIWDRRETIARQLTGQTDPEIDRQWRTDLLDLGILTAHLEARIEAPGQAGAAHERALATLAEAEQLLGPSAVLDLERVQRVRALGGEAAKLEHPVVSPASAWEHLAVGRAHLSAGDLRTAASSIDRCLATDPRSFWGNYYKGACALRRGEATEAVAAFSACVALAPDSPWCVYNRGLAYTQVGRLDAAIADFDRALALDSGLAIAFLGRAQVHHRAERLAQALGDLRRAADAGLPAPVVEYQKALVVSPLRTATRPSPAFAPASPWIRTQGRPRSPRPDLPELSDIDYAGFVSIRGPRAAPGTRRLAFPRPRSGARWPSSP